VDDHLHDLLPDAPDAVPIAALIALALAETNTTETVSNGDSDADRYSPWGRGDRFRVLQRQSN